MVQNTDNQELIKAAIAKKKAEARKVARDMSIEKMRLVLADKSGKELFDGMMATFRVATEEGKGLELEMNSTCTGIVAIAMMTAKMVAILEEPEQSGGE